MNGPEEPSADMREFARICRDMYVGLLQEGFTEREALDILGRVIAAQIGGAK